MSTAGGVYELGSSRRELPNLLRKAARYVVGSVPSVTAETLAIARIVFGAVMLYFWLNGSPQSLTSAATSGVRDGVLLIDPVGIVPYLSASVFWTQAIYWSVTACIIFFMAGCLTRIVYPALALLMWMAAFMSNASHTETPLLLALIATLTVPWGERWSVDAALSGRLKDPSIASPFYGYGIWLLGFTIAITYATAGIAKLVVTEGTWLWNTGARNGFIQDFGIAATDWGMYLTNNYSLALIASIMSAFGQAIYLYSSFTRSATVKYAICFTVAIPFLVGLVLFMGHFWWAWAVLILMLYLPWTAIDRAVVRDKNYSDFGGSPRTLRHRSYFLTIVCLLTGLHVFATVTKSELEPFYSNYPMYASQMPANSEYEREFWDKYKTYDRSYKYYIALVAQPKSIQAGIGSLISSTPQNLGGDYHFYMNISRFLHINHKAIGLAPEAVFSAVKAGTAIAPSACLGLRQTALQYAGDGSVRSVRFSKRYVDIVDGKMVWMPVANWIEVDVTSTDCPYKLHDGDPGSASVQMAGS